MKFPLNLFDLTPEQEALSKSIYEGKVIKCLIAPYHTYPQLEKEIPFSKTTYLFPERETTASQLSGIISMIVSSPIQDEFRIITTSQSIILDMIDGCVRILTEDGKIVPCPCKTFMANIHTIKYEIFDNESFRKSKVEKSRAISQINILIDKINKTKSFTRDEYESVAKDVDLIGEETISRKLKKMARDKVR